MDNLVSKKSVMESMFDHFQTDQKAVLLVGDMGFAVLDRYFEKFPQRVFNVGICEQATVSMSAGMSLAGLRPIIYSQIPFLVMRAYEQIRYDLNEHKLNVKLIGVGADNYFEKLGRSHCIDNDDIEMMRVFKNIRTFSPSQESLQEDIKKMFDYNGPTYLRCK